MKADETKDAPPTPPAPATAPTVGEGVADFLATVRASGVWNPKIALGALVVALLTGAYWFKTSSDRRSASEQWTAFEKAATATDRDALAGQYDKALVGKVARLDKARQQFGPDGVGLMTARDKDQRAKAVSNVGQARDEFGKLADEFPDLTLKAEALRGAAEAELALVGVPKNPTAPDGETYGTVAKAVSYLRAFAAVVGEGTAAGERATKRAADLEKNATQVQLAARELARAAAPPPPPDEIKPPTGIVPPVGAPPVLPGPRPPAVIPEPPASLSPAVTPATVPVRKPDPAVSPVQPVVPPVPPPAGK